MERSSKVFYALLALLALALIGGGLGAAGGEGLAFGLFAFLTVGGGLMCVFERSVVRSAFSLLATFSGTAGLFLLLGADFLAMAQILIYVGGILALILFGVMLTPPDLTERRLPRVVTGLVLVGGAVAWIGFQVRASVVWATAETLPPLESNARRIGVGFLAAGQYVVPFELAAVVLTVALVAAVYIARRKKSDLEPDAVEGDPAPRTGEP
jgi:NADH-quinone oxidoreductase subunit J